MLIFLISTLYVAYIYLPSTWCLVTTPCSFILSKVRRQANIISPSVLFFIGSTGGVAINFMQDYLVFVATYRLWGNFPVWCVYIVPLGSYTVMKKS